MRLVVILVVVCGCRAATSGPVIDASTPRGDGLVDRIVTDAALWSDLSATDSTSDGRIVDARDGAPADRAVADGSTVTDLSTEPSCALLGKECVGREGCYPFPFEGSPSGTRCAFQGIGAASIPCQSQLDCDATTLCTAPGQPDSICAQRCPIADSRCPTGFRCVPYYGYVGVGVCL